MKTAGKNLLVELFCPKTIKRLCCLGMCCWLGTVSSAFAKIIIPPDDPVGFFATVADKLLGSTFNFGVTNIPVYSNGVFVYSPAVQRLMQLSANVYDATTTNFFPSVFRPLFVRDASSNIFICGYQQVTNVSGLADPQLSPPHNISELASLPDGSPITDANGPVNVYGVPWIIGAKKGFPNFNKLGMENVIQVTRKLQVERSRLAPPVLQPSELVITNQMYGFSINNNLGIECWNSYTNAYPNPVQIMVRDSVSLLLTNDDGASQVFATYALNTNLMVTSWPGYVVGSANSFVPISQTSSFLPGDVYYFGSSPPGVHGFYLTAFNYGWESNNPNFYLPQLGLLTSNRFQLVMLDVSGGDYHVIDYVQLAGPNSSRNINSALQTTNTAQSYDNMWSTHLHSGVPYGVVNQWDASTGNMNVDTSYWKDNLFPGVSVADEITGFRYFLGLSAVNATDKGVAQYYASNYIVRLPFTPTATIYDYTGWQANDPLVHYLAADLANNVAENGGSLLPGINKLKDNVVTIPVPSYSKVNDRYQPWGVNAPALLQSALYNFNDPFNLIYKDPLVRRSDDWAFPTNILESLVSLGQVHRGTPWQTVYLKARNVLHVNIDNNYPNRGTNTWMVWTGDYDIADAALTAPLQDRQLAGLLISLLSTNDPTQLFSVNDPNFSDWLNLFDGLTVYSNSVAFANSFTVPQFDISVMASNSPQAAIIAGSVLQTKSLFPNQRFDSIADICAALSLTENSPWLNTNSSGSGRIASSQIKYGITDIAYEVIPSQLLLLLRPDSFGTVSLDQGIWNLQFSGLAGYAYELQTSTNLVDWNVVSTNYPAQGHFSVPITSPPSPQQFYRSVLLP